MDYEVAVVTCLDGQTVFEHQISSLLNWIQPFGYAPWRGNLDALSDGLSGYPFGAAHRAALAVESFHVLVAADRNRARNTLDLIESAARDHLLWGKTLIALIQTDDPDYHCVGIGGRAATWNRKEWLKADRVR